MKIYIYNTQEKNEKRRLIHRYITRLHWERKKSVIRYYKSINNKICGWWKRRPREVSKTVPLPATCLPPTSPLFIRTKKVLRDWGPTSYLFSSLSLSSFIQITVHPAWPLKTLFFFFFLFFFYSLFCFFFNYFLFLFLFPFTHFNYFFYH